MKLLFSLGYYCIREIFYLLFSIFSPNPPEYELLKGDMKGLISRRINKQPRLVDEVIEKEKLIKIYRTALYLTYFKGFLAK
jgi:hypothetical protein